MFAGHSLDLFEFGVTDFKKISEFKSMEVDNQVKPILIFQGEQFEFSDKHNRFKNYMIDLLKSTDYEEANIAEMKRVICITSLNDSQISFRQYEINVGKQINETDVNNQSLTFNEVGPHFNLTFRRNKIADSELFKNACKQPKLENKDKKKARKNMYTDEFGQQMGKVYLQHQDISTLVTRKYKKKQREDPPKKETEAPTTVEQV